MTNRAPNIRSTKLCAATIVCGSFMVGAVMGSLFASVSGKSSTLQVHDYLSDYLSLSGTAMIAIQLGNLIWSYGCWLLCCVLGIVSGFAFLTIPILSVVRGFLFSFGIACFVRFGGLRGLIPALVLMGIPALFWIPGFLLIAVPGFSDGYSIRRGAGCAEEKTRIRQKLRTHFVLSAFLIVLCIFLEYSLLPVLMHGAANLLGYGGVAGG